MAYVSAEIVTLSTPIEKITPSTIIFSLSYYVVQAALVADIIVRRKLSLWGIFLIGLIYGILEEVFYIKNPFFLTILLALGHSAVTITFPYILTNFLIPGEKKPFLDKKGYVFAGGYLLILYTVMAGFIPFAYPDSLILGIALLLALFSLLKKSGKPSTTAAMSGIKKWEKAIVPILAAFLTVISGQNYLGVMVVFIWVLLRQKVFNRQDFYLSAIFVLVFHFLASIFNKSANQSGLSPNYLFSLVTGILLIAWLWRTSKQYQGAGRFLQTSVQT